MANDISSPTKRFATVEELGALSVFLASDAAASITGIALPSRWRLDGALKLEEPVVPSVVQQLSTLWRPR
jgi:hypothetical protein